MSGGFLSPSGPSMRNGGPSGCTALLATILVLVVAALAVAGIGAALGWW